MLLLGIRVKTLFSMKCPLLEITSIWHVDPGCYKKLHQFLRPGRLWEVYLKNSDRVLCQSLQPLDHSELMVKEVILVQKMYTQSGNPTLNCFSNSRSCWEVKAVLGRRFLPSNECWNSKRKKILINVKS